MTYYGLNLSARYTVVSYPKSGRTWLRYAGHLLDYDIDFSHAGIFTQAEFIGSPWPGIPKAFEKRTIGFLHRNPLDTAVSFYFQLIYKDVVPGRKTWRRAENRGIPMPPERIADCVLDPLYGVEAVCRYNRTWLDSLSGESRAFRYEDFIAQPAPSLRDFFLWQGVPDLPAAQWADLAERTSFDNMRKVQASKEGHKFRLTQHLSDPESAKVRKGKVKGYSDYLGSHVIKKAAKIAARYGFKI